MKTIFSIKYGDLAVVPVENLPRHSQHYYRERYPEATHVVMSDASKLVYAISGSEADAEAAKAKLLEVQS